MTTELAPIEVQIPAFAIPEPDLIHTLQNSVYPGAKIENVKLVLAYCRAQRLDPLQKPIHIVPMYDKALKQMRDVLMPGIGLYRVQAARTGRHAGTSEPVFGPMVDATLATVPMTYPEWCVVTVSRLVDGKTCEFSAKEYWLENYATKDKDTVAPNAMWKRRPRGQLAKCAEAQALRKAFPELASAPTAEEMEGKHIDADETPAPAKPANEFMPTETSSAAPAKTVHDVDTETGEITKTSEPAPTKPAPTDGRIATDGMIKTILRSMERTGKTAEQFSGKFGFLPAATPFTKVNEALAWAKAA